MDGLQTLLTKNCEMVVTRVLRDLQGSAHLEGGPVSQYSLALTQLSTKLILPKKRFYTALGLIVDGVLS